MGNEELKKDKTLPVRGIRGKFFLGCIVGLILLGPRVWAQEDVFRFPLKPETMESFTAVTARLAEHPVVRGNFEQEKTLSRLGRTLKSGGNFIIAAERGMVWDTVKPFPSTLALGKDYLVQSRPGGQKTALSAEGNETFLRLAEVLSAVFSGNARGLLENFEVYFTLKNAAPVPAWEMGLSPLDRAISSFAARITMSGGQAIQSITIHEQSGDTTKYTLSNHSYGAGLDAHEKSLFALP